jgi:NAD(P) transhydrogenase subunit beta
MLTQGIQTSAYIASSVLFILSLGGLSNQESAKRGNVFGLLGMLIAILATAMGSNTQGHGALITVMALASFIGVVIAQKVEMTSMPQLVAILNSFVGLAAVLGGFGSYLDENTQKLTGAAHTSSGGSVLGNFYRCSDFYWLDCGLGKTPRNHFRQGA